MWKIHRTQIGLTSLLAAIFLIPAATVAQDHHNRHYNSYSRSSGLHLPSSSLPYGHDEVRAADGTTCRSSMAGNGPYVDVGGIGAQHVYTREMTATAYMRLIIPLGRKPQRVDCTRLYQVEIDRLRYELELARMGHGKLEGEGKDGDWADKGWTTAGEE